MNAGRASKGPNKRPRKRQVSIHSSEDESVLEPPNEPIQDKEIDKVQDTSGGLGSMSEEEMAQHLKLCMKLSAENKINMKNAFGLHLIEIMQKMVKNSARADIQQASLSLQASSKIYAGRVEALYQETCRFHGHLQSILSGGKKDKKNKNTEDFDEAMDDDEDPEARRSRPQRKCKSFLKTEESLNMEMETNALSTGEPHGNFVTINSAFSTSRLAPKLLSSLRLVNDSCMLRCAVPELCFKARKPLKNEPFIVPPKLEGIIENIKNLNMSEGEFRALLASSEKLTPNMSTPRPAAPPLLFDDDDGGGGVDNFDPVCNDSMMPPPEDAPDLVEATIERFDVLNITVDAFVNDISVAVTNGGVDHNLLPPNSALKKMLDKSKRSSVKQSVSKSTKRKAREPFFNGRTANDIKHLFAKGRTTTVSQRILSEWSVNNTSNIDLGYEFMEDLEGRSNRDAEDTLKQMELTQVLDVIKQNDLQYYFKYYFNKESQMWKVSRRKMCLDLSFPGTPFGNKTEKRVGSIAPNEPEGLAVSFQNLSLHESIHEAPLDMGGNTSDYNDDAPTFVDSEEPQFLVPPEPFETDIEEMMVKPPELVRPTCVKFDQRPVNLNTERIKQLLWMIISKHLESDNNTASSSEPFVLFSKVYEELKYKLEREISEFISMQFAFVVLLILANQKTLLIENVEENTDLSIKKDISEIDSSQTV